jgi:hypothetical protein
VVAPMVNIAEPMPPAARAMRNCQYDVAAAHTALETATMRTPATITRRSARRRASFAAIGREATRDEREARRHRAGSERVDAERLGEQRQDGGDDAEAQRHEERDDREDRYRAGHTHAITVSTESVENKERSTCYM